VSRPDSTPEWASDAAYPAGTDAWSATDTKIEPTTGEKESGATPQTGFGAQQFNWLLNNHSNALTFLMSAIAGHGVYVRDEFTGDPGDTIPEVMWELLTAGAGVAPAYIDDSAAGASGAAAFVLSAAGTSRINARCIVGTSDFFFICRVRRVSTAGAAGTMTIGLHGTDCLFRSTAGGNWFAKYGASTTDTGVAASTSYQWLEIERRAGVVEFRIAGAVEYSGAFATDLTTSDVGVYLFDGTANAAEYRVDMAMIWVDRS
jgi:hypothetical protein